MEKEEVIRYLEVLIKNGSVYQPEIRDALNSALEILSEK